MLVDLELKVYKIESTCLFDSICELMIHTMKCNKHFLTYITEVAELSIKSAFLAIIKNYVLSKLKSRIVTFYSRRFHFLLEYGRVVNNTVYCDDDIEIFFRKIMEDNPSIEYERNCCAYNIFNYTVKIVIDKSGSTLEENVIKFIERNTFGSKICKECGCLGEQKLQEIYYLAVIPEVTTEMELRNIPEVLKIDRSTFSLTGVIGFTPPEKPKNSDKGHYQNHYIAYCRFVESNCSSWSKRDDMRNTSYKADTKKPIKVALIFFNKLE